MDGTSFVLTIVGKGWNEKLAEPTDAYSSKPEKELVVQVSGPELGYVATPICMVQAALVLLREADKLPSEYVRYSAHTPDQIHDVTILAGEAYILLERHLLRLR